MFTGISLSFFYFSYSHKSYCGIECLINTLGVQCPVPSVRRPHRWPLFAVVNLKPGVVTENGNYQIPTPAAEPVKKESGGGKGGAFTITTRQYFSQLACLLSATSDMVDLAMRYNSQLPLWQIPF